MCRGSLADFASHRKICVDLSVSTNDSILVTDCEIKNDEVEGFEALFFLAGER